MKTKTDRNKAIVQASIIGIIGNAIMAIGKITAGVLGSSVAVLSDGVDSLTDIATSSISLLAARISVKPANARFPYGYQRAETIGVKALSFIMFFAGIQLIINAGGSLLRGEVSTAPALFTIVVTLGSILGKSFLAWYKISLGKKHDASILKADGQNMLMDIVTSAVVLAGLGLSVATGWGAIDRIAAILVSLWILKNAWGIFMETNIELMDGISDVEVYDDIIAAVALVPGAQNPHRLRARRVGNEYVIVMDCEVDPSLTISQAHEIAKEVENSVKQKIPSVYDVLVHLEPLGNKESDECFGVSAAPTNDGCQGEEN